jgi:2-iminobutanoate/2-iminopropanoate deaminase
MKRVIRTTDAPTGNASGAFPFSQAVVAGGLVFVAGQGPLDPETGAIVGDTIQEQTRQALRNVEAILTAAGSSMDRIANVLFLLASPEDFAGLNEEWARWFPKDPPARSGAKFPLAVPNFRISLSVVAEAGPRA